MFDYRFSKTKITYYEHEPLVQKGQSQGGTRKFGEQAHLLAPICEAYIHGSEALSGPVLLHDGAQ